MTTMLPGEAVRVLLLEVSKTRHRRALVAIERSYAAAIRRGFKRQARAFIPVWLRSRNVQVAQLAEDEGDTWVSYFNEAVDATDTMFRSATEEATEQAMRAGVRNAALDIGIDLTFDVATDPRAIQYVQDHGAEMLRNVTDTTRDRVRLVINRGITNGRSYQQVAADLRKLYAGWSTPDPRRHIRDRAELIAVTEMGNAYSYAALEAANDLEIAGLPMQKSWLSTGDSRVDLPHCRANEAQGWIPLRQQFQSGHDRPLAHPGCRCSLLTEMKMEGQP